MDHPSPSVNVRDDPGPRPDERAERAPRPAGPDPRPAGPDVERRRGAPVEGFNLNEALLYHGADSQNIAQILERGPNPGYAGTNAGSLFGLGNYFALNSSKADIYTKPSRRYRSGARCVLVCRVLLGEPYRTVAPCQTIRKPPDDPLRHLSSVVALTLKASPIRGCVMYPEFVVFERAQCLPQYAIWYEHAAGCRCTHCAPPRFSG